MSQSFFKKVLFYNISESKVFTGSFSLCQERKKNILVDFGSSERDILEKINSQTLLVVPEFHPNLPMARLANCLYETGSCWVIPFSFWEENSLKIIELMPFNLNTQTEILLAFFEKREEKLFSALFSLYGFSVISVNSLEQLKKELLKKVNLILLNLDFSFWAKESSSPKEIYSFLRFMYCENPQLAICAMKDFSKVDFFQDLKSPVKEFCRTIFSPCEMFLFFRDYLYAYFFSKLWEICHSHISKFFFKSFTLPLRDIPPLLNKLGTFSEKEEDRKDSLLFENLVKLRLSQKLTEGFAHYLKKAENYEKAYFHFIEKDPLLSLVDRNPNYLIFSELGRALP